jgi:hypothetical protein
VPAELTARDPGVAPGSRTVDLGAPSIAIVAWRTPNLREPSVCEELVALQLVVDCREELPRLRA